MKLLNLKYKMHKLVNLVFYLIIFAIGFLLGFGADKINVNKIIGQILFIDNVNAATITACRDSVNLFNINGEYLNAYGNPTISENSITLPSSADNVGSTRFTQKIKVNGSLVLSFIVSGGGGYARPLLIPLDSAGNLVTDLTIDGYTYLDFYKGYYKNIPDGSYEQVLTFPETINYLQLGFVHISGTFTNIQIEKGNTATSYESYDEKICFPVENDSFYDFSQNIFGEVSEENKFIYDFITFGLVVTCFTLFVLVVGYIFKKFFGG